HLKEQVRQLVDILQREMGICDPLTGLFGKRYLFERLIEEIDRSDRFGQSVSLILARLQGGEERVMRTVGQAMRRACRRYDIPSRMGEWELAIALPGTEREDAKSWAERFLDSLLPLLGESKLSLAVRHYPSPDAQDAPSLMEATERALDQASEAGKSAIDG
ncbi:MAG TPA: GGDEF domain-containing protein, partial [Chroococcales cyanobacterium]